MSGVQHWPVVAIGAIIWKDDSVLLIRRGRPPRQGQWSIPGGKQEAGETVHQAAHREIREETGLEIELLGVTAVIDLIDREQERILYHYTVIDFLAEWRSGTPVAADDAEAVGWFTLDELAGLDLPEIQRKVIADAARQRDAAA